MPRRVAGSQEQLVVGRHNPDLVANSSLLHDRGARQPARVRTIARTKCKWKEPEAAVFADSELSCGLQEAESWIKDTFQTTVSERLDFVRCVRASYHMGGKTRAFLHKLPWFIVRIFL